jgi:hypothetical protein
LGLREHLGLYSASDSYLSDKSDRGYCRAYKVTSVEPMNVPKCNDFSFPRGGRLWFDDPNLVAASGGVDGRYTDELWQIATTANDEGSFEPQTLDDKRERRLSEIVHCRGQPEFRAILIRAYGGYCAITGCDALSALEAAHIVPYSWARHRPDIRQQSVLAFFCQDQHPKTSCVMADRLVHSRSKCPPERFEPAGTPAPWCRS